MQRVDIDDIQAASFIYTCTHMSETGANIGFFRAGTTAATRDVDVDVDVVLQTHSEQKN